MAIPGKVVLLGANGAIGRTLGPLLSARGLDYRVVGRSLLALQIRFHEDPHCEHQQWDLEDKDAFDLACAGAGTVVFLIGAPVWKFAENLTLATKALAAAKVAGAQRFLLVSSNWSYSPPFDKPIREDHPRHPATEKGKIRRDQEDRVAAAHLPGSFATGVLRMADLYGPKVEQSHLWTAFQAAKRGTLAQVLGPIDRPHEFVYVPDAASTILELLEKDEAWAGEKAGIWNLAGPAVTTIQSMIKLVFATEKKPEQYKVPGPMMMRFVRTMNPYIRGIADMQYLLDQTILLDDTHLHTLLGEIKKTPYAEAIRQTLALR
jgi:nucleoside-diphosphate-sugar epimerase